MMVKVVRTLVAGVALLMGLAGATLVLQDVMLSPVADGDFVSVQAYGPATADVAVPHALHYQALNSGEQGAYEALCQGISAHEQSFGVVVANSDDIEAALHAIMSDHPEFFWLTGACTYRDAPDGTTYIELAYNMEPDSIDAAQELIDEAVASYLASLPPQATTYDKVHAAYEWVINTTDYGYGSAQHQNIQSVFIDHVSVCAGYAKAYQYLLGQAGVPCAYIRGSIDGETVDHAWNLVYIDGTPTFVDVTWGDPTYVGAGGEAVAGGISYDYLCLTTEEMQRCGHVVATGEPVPVCDSTAYDYYRLNGLLFDVYDRSQTDDAFRRAFGEGASSLSVKFISDDAYGQAHAALDDASLLQGAFIELAAERQGAADAIRYQSVTNDDLRILTVFW